MRRFYSDVTVTPDGKAFALVLDGKPMKTPAGHAFQLPTEKLAKAIAQEWAAQRDTIKPASMPLTQLATTAIDIICGARAEAVARVMAYLGSELLCLRDDKYPLKERQEKAWDAPLAWLQSRFDVHLNVADGLKAPAQSEAAFKRLSGVVEAMDDWHLIALQSAVLACGSLVLGLALMEKHYDAAQVFELAELETTHQIEKWGEDEELMKRRDSVLVELRDIERYIELL